MTRFLIAAVACCLCAVSTHAQELDPLILRAKMNGQTVNLSLRTGMTGILLFDTTAARLKLTLPEAEGERAVGATIPLEAPPAITLGGTPLAGDVSVLVTPRAITTADGLVGWDVVRDRVLYMSLGAKLLVTLDSLPEPEGWQEHTVVGDAPTLQVATATDAGDAQRVAIDTGRGEGLALGPAAWERYVAAADTRPYTLNAMMIRGVGLKVTREYLEPTWQLNGQALRWLSVTPDLQAAEGAPGVLIGRQALSQLEVMIDAANGRLYTKPRTADAPATAYNRLGAVFAPVDMTQQDLVATVAPGSPAAAAGIQDGDVLLAVEDLDVTAWRTDPRVMPISRFFVLPAGTTMALRLRRGDAEYTANATLADYLTPVASEATETADQ